MEDKELLEIWKECEKSRRKNLRAEAQFEGLTPNEKIRLFDLIKNGEHLE